jgi:ComF family protein
MMAKAIPRTLNRFVDMVLPPRCLVTGDVVDSQGMLSPAAWADLRFVAAPLCGCCGYPFEFEIGPEALCAACLRQRPCYETARSALIYDDASRGVILKFKHGDRTEGVPVLSGWMERAGAAMLREADVIVPVPLHRWRLLARRYNQSALLAQALAKRSGKDCIADVLVRVRATGTQGQKGFRERHRNVRGAFAVNPKRAGQVQGKTVVLVDDVYTSGATIEECAKTLLNGGAARVHVLTLARVVKPDYVL